MTAGVAIRRDAGLEYLGALDEAFARSERESGGVRDVSMEIGGRTLRLRFADEVLARALTAALSHHPVPAVEAPELTICAFDLATGRIHVPPFPWDPEDVRERGEIRGFNNDCVCTIYEPESAMLSMLDVARRRAFLGVADKRRLRSWHLAAPMRTILHWLLTSSTRVLAHAAAVGIGGDGVLLAGAGGSGKSTTAVACAAAGMQYAGDDYVLLESAPSPTVHSLYATAKLTDGSLAMLPPLGQAVWHRSLEDEKRVIDVAHAFPNAITRALGVRAIVLPRVIPGGPTRVARGTAGDAVRALAPTTIYQLPRNGGGALTQVADLARRVPTYSLTVGDPASAAGAIADLLHGS